MNQPEKLVGIEITGSYIKGVSVDQSGELINEHKISMAGGSDSFQLLVAFINELSEKFGKPERIGIAVPGLIDRKTKRVVYSTFIPEHEKKEYFSELESETGFSIQVENDANAAAFGEFMIGAGRGSRNMFYATLGTGVGGAFIFDGKIWRGAAGFAGEFGSITVNSEGMQLEGVASATGVVERTKKRFHQDDTSSLSRIGEQDITLDDIVAAANNEDDFAIMMLERTGNYVGTAIASVINLLNIEKIVVGGPIMRAGDVVLEAIIARAKEISFAPSFESTEILCGALGENAGAIGAALMTLES
jgi:glucokinase